MSMISPFTNLLRSALDVTTHKGAEAVERSPLHAAVVLEENLDQLAHSLLRAAESAEREVEVLDGVARSLPAMTELVTAMNEQAKVMNEQAKVMNEQAKVMNRRLEELVELLAPVRDVEHGVSHVGHLFHRHRDDQSPAGEDQT